jgi:Ca-activated chloride channel family protein
VRQPRSRPAVLLVVLATIAAARLIAGGQTGSSGSQPPIRDNKRFESGIEVTSIAATVTDKEGHPLIDLTQQNFEVYEDGVKQTITQFTHERVPIGLGVLLDISDSMFGKRIQDARAAVDRFLFDLLDPDDEFFLAAFNHRPRVLTGWTRDRSEVERELAALKPTGGTAIYDAIIAAVPLIERRSRPRAAILVISDGADTASTATLRELHTVMVRSDAFVYAIAIDSPEPQPINTRVNVQTLREITGESGGRTEVVHNAVELNEATARIADELNSQYMLGYTSPHGADGQFHSIRVRVPGTDDRVRSRNGYVAVPVARRSGQ